MAKQQKHKCAECGNEQVGGSYCQACCGTVMYETGPKIPINGTPVKSSGMNLISLGEMDPDGGLRVSLPQHHPEFWGKVYHWEAVK